VRDQLELVWIEHLDEAVEAALGVQPAATLQARLG
jgi:hypothetical protein